MFRCGHRPRGVRPCGRFEAFLTGLGSRERMILELRLRDCRVPEIAAATERSERSVRRILSELEAATAAATAGAPIVTEPVLDPAGPRRWSDSKTPGERTGPLLQFAISWSPPVTPSNGSGCCTNGSSSISISAGAASEAKRRRERTPRPSRSPRLLDGYASEFLELGPVVQLPIELIAEEYRVRRRWGDRPAHDDYFVLFRPPGAAGGGLEGVDREVVLEAVDEAPIPTPASLTGIELTEGRSLLTEGHVLLQLHLGTGGLGRVYRCC